MGIKEAFKVLNEGLEMASKKGVYSLTDSAMIYQALQVIGKRVILIEEPVMDEKIPEVAEKQSNKAKK